MENSSCVSEMTPEEEMAVIGEIIDSSESRVKEGDSFYLITLRWWQEWLDYVRCGISGGTNNASSSFADNCELEDSTISKRPSRIDNSELIYDMTCEEEPETSAELHDSLTEGRDYILLPEEVWKELYIWYGGGPTLSRKVISSASPETGLSVEIYLLRLQLILMPKGEQAFIRISKRETIGELCKRACDIFDLTADQICIWNYYGHKKQALMNDMDKTLDDANIKMDQEILLELRGDGVACGDCMSSVQVNGSAGKESASLLAEPCKSNVSIGGGLSTIKGVTRSCTSEISQSQFLASPVGEVDGSDGTNGVVVRGSTSGLTGLLNLGNTCFMNSAIQCLVHTPEFARYFREDYHQEINWQNPLGMVGELAMAFGELLRKLWSPGRAPVSPRPFKTKLARFAPQFSGYNQHDSQELLAFLLDGLHEDLNRVKFKPYIKSKDADGRPDEEVADEYWANHIARNDSIIVDVCQGQYKSTLVCPVCGKVSITFDPFMYLSLPLPSTKTRSMTLMVFSSDGGALPTPCTVTVPKHGKCKDLIQSVSSACSLKTGEKLLLAEIRCHLIHRFLDDPLLSLSTIKDDDHLAAYKLPKFDKKHNFSAINTPSAGCVSSMKEPNNAHSKMVWKPYGTPLVAPILEDVNTRGDIQKIVRVMLAPMRRAEMSEPSEPEKAKVAAEQASQGLDASDACSDCPMEKVQNGREETSSVKLPLQLVDENNVCIDLSVGEDKPIRLPTSSSILVFIDWSEKDLEKYDTHYLDNLPEVFKYGNVNKKSRTEPRAESLSLYTCLEAFLREEPLVPEDMWYCPRCKERRQASKKLDLWRLPEVLVIHLKRFSYSRSVKHKLENFVNFPIHDLDLTNYVANKNSGRRQLYELYALSNHYGGMGSGHYTAHIKILEENRWYNFDDSHISPITEEEVKSAAAYVFFYRRVKGEAGSTGNGSLSPAEQEKISCNK